MLEVFIENGIVNPDVIFDQTVERMTSLGTYRKEFDVEIRIYSELLSQYQETLNAWRNDGGAEVQVMNSGRVSKSPYVRAMEALRKDIVVYSDRLGLNPKALKGMEVVPVEEGKTLLDVLDKIASNL